ncbi:hypothetical protein [Hyalangium rubrum]|uniref:Uncharacterized protein n=1 Tax=Hyalangium rubrum TaxID=3103134 RepID=A0ABU5H0L0_9BACT|nr:hypothetical protein [Hyalangium sp. s54d21]MDY7226642.1 hypothetical protein [Hyalangium sp. s54d21]
MINHVLKAEVLRNFIGKRNDQFQSEWVKISGERLAELLIEAMSRPTPGSSVMTTNFIARRLIEDMRVKEWIITAGPHEGGKGDATRGVDWNLHITLWIKRKSYHLTCKEQPQLHIIQISGPGIN